MSKTPLTFFYALGLVVVIGFIVVALAALDRRANPGDTVDPSGASSEGALIALRELEDELATTPIEINIGLARFELIPATIGFDLDEESTLRTALATGSADSVIESAGVWTERDVSTVSFSIMGTIDEGALYRTLDRYDLALDRPFEGGIALEGTTPIPQYPRPGLVIDRSTAGPRIAAALLERPRPESVTLDTVHEPPTLPAAAVDTALEEAHLLLGGPIVLTRTDPNATLHLSREQLARALITRAERAPNPRLVVTFDPVVIDEYLQALRAGFEAPAADARLVIDQNDNITIIPGLPGARIDTDLVIEAANHAARRATRTTILPLNTGVAPSVNVEDLLSLGVKGKISEFTTNHRCCQPRVNNIHLFADSLDGRIMRTGEEMSLNDTVGQRTTEKGYVPAPTIIKGEIEDTVGGGVSQFATTFYNAVFWAGLEIIEHQPHSYYFSRYPEGIEATISWRQPDLVFRNDTSSAIVIKTSHTGTSITVKLFGDNSDRTVTSWVSDRFAPMEFPTTYLPNPEVMPWDEEVEVRAGADGWSVTVTRDLAFSDGTTTRQDWNVRYRPWARQVEVHPCLLPEDSEEYTGEECPEGPATTIPSTSETPDESTTSTTAVSVPDTDEESPTTTAAA